MKLTKENWKHVIMSILIGAGVAFLSSFFDGIIDLLKGYGNDYAGGLTAATTYLAKYLKT